MESELVSVHDLKRLAVVVPPAKAEELYTPEVLGSVRPSATVVVAEAPDRLGALLARPIPEADRMSTVICSPKPAAPRAAPTLATCGGRHIPAVVYGQGMTPVAVAVDRRELRIALSGAPGSTPCSTSPSTAGVPGDRQGAPAPPGAPHGRARRLHPGQPRRGDHRVGPGAPRGRGQGRDDEAASSTRPSTRSRSRPRRGTSPTRSSSTSPT